MDRYMYVVRKVEPAQYWGERKRENRDTHIHVTSGQSLPSPDDAPRLERNLPLCVLQHTHNRIAEQGCGQESYTGTGDSTAASLAANTQT